MKYSILLILLLLTACATPEEMQRRREEEARMTPRERCIKDADDSAGSCALMCLGQIVSNNPNGQACLNQCTQTKLNYYQACSYK
jgi:hypothetical protein